MKLNYKVDKDTADFFNNCLSSEAAIEKYKEEDVIETFTVDLGRDYEVDFKLINGSKDSSPWLDVVLFNGGSEVSCLVSETLEGEYFFTDLDEDEIELEISVK